MCEEVHPENLQKRNDENSRYGKAPRISKAGEARRSYVDQWNARPLHERRAAIVEAFSGSARRGIVELPKGLEIKRGPEPDPNACAKCAAAVAPGEKCPKCGEVNRTVVKKY